MSADVGYIIGIMERLAPERMAEGWDNPGLHLGMPSAKVKRILVALDPVEEVAREAVDKNADLLITHHPFFFEPVKTLGGPSGGQDGGYPYTKRYFAVLRPYEP